MERLRCWLNFGKDGPWAWWWFVLRSGCWRGHDWQEDVEVEFVNGVGYYGDSYRICLRCGQWGGWVK